jgi:chemotaxis response regulator CheB
MALCGTTGVNGRSIKNWVFNHLGGGLADFPIVGIGSSAGGLEALQKLFGAMPSDSGFAFVVAAHLDPTHESHLSALLSRCTKMPVAEIANSVKVEPDQVYVIAPDQELTIKGGVLHTNQPTAPRGHRHPVELLLPLARRGSRGGCHRDRAVRHGHQRLAGAALHQGRRRHRDRT